MLLTELQSLVESCELISIERDCHDEELTGFIRYLSDSLVTMQLFDNEGNYEGFAAFEFSQISEVFWGNREHKAIRHLIDSKPAPKEVRLESTDFASAIQELNQQFPSLCLHSSNDEDRYEIAHIEASDEDWCKILAFSTMKSLSRTFKLIKRDVITRVVVDSPYQNAIVDLHSLDC